MKNYDMDSFLLSMTVDTCPLTFHTWDKPIYIAKSLVYQWNLLAVDLLFSNAAKRFNGLMYNFSRDFPCIDDIRQIK